MTLDDKSEAVEPVVMRKRRTRLADGRYEIFYTFDSESDSPHSVEEGSQVEIERAEEKENDV